MWMLALLANLAQTVRAVELLMAKKIRAICERMTADFALMFVTLVVMGRRVLLEIVSLRSRIGAARLRAVKKVPTVLPLVGH